MYEDVQLILTELGFVHSGRYRKDPSVDVLKERDLLDALWNHLKGDFYGEVLMKNLKSFIWGILGLKYTWMLHKNEESTSSKEFKSYDSRLKSMKYSTSKLKTIK